MQLSRLVKKFNMWQKSSKNLMKKESLLEQVELFQFLEDFEVDTENFVDELVKSNNKYSRLIKRGSVEDEYFQEDW